MSELGQRGAEESGTNLEPGFNEKSTQQKTIIGTANNLQI